MRYVKLPEEKVYEFLERLKGHGPLYAPVKVSEKCVDFREIDDVKDVVFEYTRTLTPPKKYFFPPKEVMFRYDMKKVDSLSNTSASDEVMRNLTAEKEVAFAAKEVPDIELARVDTVADEQTDQ